MKEAAVYNPDGGTTEGGGGNPGGGSDGDQGENPLGENNYKLLITNHYGRNEKIKIRVGHCPQSNHHRSHRLGGRFSLGSCK